MDKLFIAWYSTAETRPKVPTLAASVSVPATQGGAFSDSVTASHGGAASDSMTASHSVAASDSVPASQRIEPLRVRIQMQERLDMFHARCTVHVMVVQIHVPRTHHRQWSYRPHGGVRFGKAWMDDGGAVMVMEVRLAVKGGAGGGNNTAAVVHRNSIIKGGALLEG
jgi:hypothetical protein